MQLLEEHQGGVSVAPGGTSSRSECSSWRDIKVVNDHAYIVAEAQ